MEQTLDIVTADELHEALVYAVLLRDRSISNVAEFMSANKLESKIAFRNVRQADGTIQLMAAVSIARPKAATSG